ncbi:secretory complex protein 62, putative [Plasmodium ovale]|uniref:Translocation protein SEC62 n=2 Tax=Plasmodium ovale TaxID=36330 RepID=A0A1A8WY08_PLAOA|nr:secretory complex protein 62 (SEC62) [Plasmodium ovale curtisi]SBS97252.1 secretory complex protein 62 (SEC62) [Plasmodium ovale curtisi]SCP05898.1 secretory complex protein 62, putative [Plasmodium ovale]
MSRSEDLDPDLLGVLKCAFDEGVKVKSAAEVGKRAVEYFRGDEFVNFLSTKKDMLKSKFPNLFINRNLSDIKEIEEFADLFIQKGLIYKAQYKPIKGVFEKDENGMYRRPKWPRRLIMTSKQNFDKTSFYILVYERNKKLQYLMLISLICIVLLCCMFPVWPLKLKLALWHLSVAFISLISVMVIGRLLAFIFFWFFGVDYWIFPNLFDEECNVVESFTPIHSWVYRNDTWFLVIARMFTAVLLAIGIHQLGKTHSMSDIKNFATQSFIDVIEWGNKKLAASPENVSMYKSLDSKATFEGQEEEEDDIVYDENEENYDCLKRCGFQTFEELVRKCFLKCECMEKILKSDCYKKKCSRVTKEVLDEAHKEACFGKSKN